MYTTFDGLPQFREHKYAYGIRTSLPALLLHVLIPQHANTSIGISPMRYYLANIIVPIANVLVPQQLLFGAVSDAIETLLRTCNYLEY